MNASGHGTSVLQYDFDNTENILVLSPESDAKTDEACTHLLRPSSPRQDLLCLSIGQSPDQRLAVWRKHSKLNNWTRVGFVPIGEIARSSVPSGPNPSDRGDKYVIRPVDHPANLTEIGIRVTNFLSDWASDEVHLVVCVHSLTELLRHVSLRKTYQFLNVMTHQLKAADALSHFHFDPTNHDERTVNLLKSMFDTVLQSTDTETWDISR